MNIGIRMHGLAKGTLEERAGFTKERKPHIQMTLENTMPANTEEARLRIEALGVAL